MHFMPNFLSSKSWSSQDLKVFDVCHHIHKHAEDVYMYLASMHTEHRELGKTWGLLAIDKYNHSQAYKLAERIKGQGIGEIHLSEAEATNILNKMKTIPTNANSNTPPLSTENALRFVAQMEDILSKVHFSNVATFQDQQDAILLTTTLISTNKIQKMISEHII
jgi:hypothetical protein